MILVQGIILLKIVLCLMKAGVDFRSKQSLANVWCDLSLLYFSITDNTAIHKIRDALGNQESHSSKLKQSLI